MDMNGPRPLRTVTTIYLQSKMSLMGASLGNSVAVVQRLLDLGKDPNEKDKVLILILFDFGKVYLHNVSFR